MGMELWDRRGVGFLLLRLPFWEGDVKKLNRREREEELRRRGKGKD
jgi:hypothetical protein